MYDHFLPHLSLPDLVSLDHINRAASAAIHPNYWKCSVRHAIKTTPAARLILRRRGIDVDSWLTDDANQDRDELFYKRRTVQLNGDLQRLKENLRNGSFTQHHQKHRSMYGEYDRITGTGRFLFIEVVPYQGDAGMEVWEMVASGRTFQFRQAIHWRETLPEDDWHVSMMDCTEEWLAVAFWEGLVTVWGWRAGETALELRFRLDYYHQPGSMYDNPVYIRWRQDQLIIWKLYGTGPSPCGNWKAGPPATTSKMAEIPCKPMALKTAVDMQGKTVAVATETSSGPAFWPYERSYAINFFDMEQQAVIRVIPVTHTFSSMFWVGKEDLLLGQTVNGKPKVEIVSAMTGASKFQFKTCGEGEDEEEDDDYDDPSVRCCDGVHFVVASQHRLKLFKFEEMMPIVSWRNPIPDEYEIDTITFASFDGVHLVCCAVCDRFILDFMPGQPAVWPE